MWPGAGGGDDDDLFCEGRANMEQQGNEQQRFPTLVVAGSNNTPTEEFVKLPIKMLYLNVKLSHNELPSFPFLAQARKQKCTLSVSSSSLTCSLPMQTWIHFAK